jgi:hypothetical protein
LPARASSDGGRGSVALPALADEAAMARVAGALLGRF